MSIQMIRATPVQTNTTTNAVGCGIHAASFPENPKPSSMAGTTSPPTARSSSTQTHLPGDT